MSVQSELDCLLIKEPATKQNPMQKFEAVSQTSSFDIIDKIKKSGQWANCPQEREDWSALDMSFANVLAFWCAEDKNMMDDVFRESPLYRPKWDEPHSTDGRTYGQITLNKCLDTRQSSKVAINPDDYRSAKNGDYEVQQRVELETLERNRLVKASALTTNIEPPRWLIKGIIPEQGLLEIFGASGSYKTFVLLDMMFCISAELSYHGLKTEKGTVVYIAGEGSNGIKLRLKALELHYGTKDYDFYILPMPSNLMDKNEIAKLSKEISAISSNGVTMVMFDTLHRNSSGSDENSSKDFAVILGNVDTFIKPISKVVGWVHHTGVSDEAQKRSRGTSSRYGAMDTVILVEKGTFADSAVISNTKQKDSEEFATIDFNFKLVNLGLKDDDGIELKSLVPTKSVSNNCSSCTDSL